MSKKKLPEYFTRPDRAGEWLHWPATPLANGDWIHVAEDGQRVLVEFGGSASGLFCRELKQGGSIHCPGYGPWRGLWKPAASLRARVNEERRGDEHPAYDFLYTN